MSIGIEWRSACAAAALVVASLLPQARAAAPETKPDAAKSTPAAKSTAVCPGLKYCREDASLAIIVTGVRPSRWDSTATQLVTLNVTLRNKAPRALVLGYDKRTAVVVDDAGNRYAIHSAQGVPEVAQGRAVDTSFVLAPGETADARFEFYWQGRTLVGTVYDVDLSLRELEILPGGQVRFGREHALSVTGMTKGTATAVAASGPAGATGAVSPSAQTTSSAAAGATPSAGAVAATPAAGAVAAAQPADPCGGSSACVATGAFVAEVVRVAVSQPSNGPVNAERVVRFEVRFRNLSDRPLILAHDPASGAAIDDNGNRYGYWNARVNVTGIGQVWGNQIDPSFQLRPGEARAGSFEMRFVYYATKSVPVDRYSLDLAVQEIEPLPANQLRVVREHALGFHDLTPRTRGASAQGGGNPQEIVEGLRKLFKKKQA